MYAVINKTQLTTKFTKNQSHGFLGMLVLGALALALALCLMLPKFGLACLALLWPSLMTLALW